MKTLCWSFFEFRMKTTDNPSIYDHATSMDIQNNNTFPEAKKTFKNPKRYRSSEDSHECTGECGASMTHLSSFLCECGLQLPHPDMLSAFFIGKCTWYQLKFELLHIGVSRQITLVCDYSCFYYRLLV